MIASTFSRSWDTAWSHIAVFVPKFIGFLIILVIGYFVAKLLARLLNAVLERVGFDGWVERGGVKQALARSRYDASDILAKIVFWAVMLFVLQLAFGVFGPNPISDIIHGIIAFLPNIFVAILILVIAGAIGRAVAELIESTLGGVSGGTVLARVAGVAILAVGVFAALDQLHIARPIVDGLFYALLALVVGAGVIAIGVGGIPTMRRYWERWSGQLESKTAEARRAVEQRRVRADSYSGSSRGATTSPMQAQTQEVVDVREQGVRVIRPDEPTRQP